METAAETTWQVSDVTDGEIEHSSTLTGDRFVTLPKNDELCFSLSGEVRLSGPESGWPELDLGREEGGGLVLYKQL